MDVKKRILALPVVAVLALTPAVAQAHCGHARGKSSGKSRSSHRHHHESRTHGAGRRVH